VPSLFTARGTLKKVPVGTLPAPVGKAHGTVQPAMSSALAKAERLAAATAATTESRVETIWD
jgi:hypothetical protein